MDPENSRTMTFEETNELEKAPPSDTIKVSNNRSLFFYVDLATKFLLTHETVEVSGLGGVVTIAEILKSQDVAKIISIDTSLTTLQEHGSPPKPKIEVKIQKSDNFEEVFKQKKILAQENKEIHNLVEQAQREMQERLKQEASK